MKPFILLILAKNYFFNVSIASDEKKETIHFRCDQRIALLSIANCLMVCNQKKIVLWSNKLFFFGYCEWLANHP